MIEPIPYGSRKRHRVNGEIVDVVGARPTRVISCGDGPVDVTLLTWGDIFLAHRSTGFPNIEVYAAFDPEVVRRMDIADMMRVLSRSKLVRNAAKRIMEGGSTEDQRAHTTTTVWCEAKDSDENAAVSRLNGPEAGQTWTALATLAAVAKVLSRDASLGFQTPSLAHGPDFVLETKAVVRSEIR